MSWYDVKNAKYGTAAACEKTDSPDKLLVKHKTTTLWPKVGVICSEHYFLFPCVKHQKLTMSVGKLWFQKESSGDKSGLEILNCATG